MTDPKIGDVVQLISGGPSMAVELLATVRGVLELHVVWLDSAGHVQRAVFRPELLRVKRKAPRKPVAEPMAMPVPSPDEWSP